MEPGTHVLSVEDDLGNELTGIFTVTASSALEADPVEAAVGYNVSFMGTGFIHENMTALSWYVYNSTWDMEISNRVNYTGTAIPVMVNGTGFFTGVWTLPETLLLGNTYTVNASAEVTTPTGVDLMTWAEANITIVEEEIDIRPNKGSYSLGDIVTFTIKATFAKAGSYLEIRDPNGELIFLSTFHAADWMFIDPWQVVLIYNQVSDASMNPFMLPSDGVIGEWTWALYDVEDEVVNNGTITVLPTTAEQVDARLSDVESGLSDLQDDIAGVTSDLEDDIDALSDEIGDVKSDLETVKDDIIGDLSDEIAGAKDAANAASDAVDDLKGSVSDLESSVSDIADTASNAKDAADAAADAASDAASAAEDASSAASGLTTLVYGAIGASLIAALAAIVSLMQISRRIAG
jgi:archaellum component FlaC